MQGYCHTKISYLHVVLITVLCFVVTVQCARPVIYGLPTKVYLGDQETTERLVDFINATELNSLGFSCAVSSITGTLSGANVATNGNEFQIKYDNTNSRYELWTTTAGAAVFEDTTVDEYRVSITCTNSNGEVSTGTNYFDVGVINNDRLIFSTLPTTTTKSAAAISASTTIYTETVRDHGGSSDGIVCSLKHASLSGYFDVNPATCAVFATADLIGIDASIPSVTLMIGATDPTTKITAYSTLTVSLTNQNTKPTTNTNGAAVAQTWPESTVAGTLLHAVTVSDPDSGQTHTYSMNCTPTTGDSFVDIDSNGQIKVINALNYETANFFDCDYYISDGRHTGGPFDYNITVTNVNDAPTFGATTYYATFAEGAAGTLATSNPNITCTDEDTTNTKSYSFLSSTNSQYFSVDSSGRLSFAQAYDVDNSVNPSSLVLTLLCVDGNTVDGTTKTGTATLSITVTDANDNAPIFSPTSYTIYVNQATQAGATIGTYKPTDADSGTNGQYTCASTTSSSYGSVYSVLADCSIVLTTQTKPFGDGTAVQYTVTATDQGSPALTGTGYVNVIYQETATTTVATTTTTAYNFFSRGENIAMFVLLLLAALALLGLLAWCLTKMCCGGGNMCDCGPRNRKPRRRAITPEDDRTPPRRRRNYSPEPQPKVTYIRERPPMPVQTMFKPPPPYYPRAMPGTFPGSPFVPLR